MTRVECKGGGRIASSDWCGGRCPVATNRELPETIFQTCTVELLLQDQIAKQDLHLSL
jgi:hypothetical protein